MGTTRILEHFHKLFAKCQNALRGRWENFWSSEQTSVVRLVDPNDIIDKMTYALTNPVKDGIVEKAHHLAGSDFSPTASSTASPSRPRARSTSFAKRAHAGNRRAFARSTARIRPPQHGRIQRAGD